jgi:hypothetical protein
VTDIGDRDQRIALTIELDQQKQFRLGHIEVFGLDPKTEARLRSVVQPDDIFNNQIIQNFITENQSSLPPDASSADVEVHRNVKDGTADVRFNFQSCPQLQQ